MGSWQSVWLQDRIALHALHAWSNSSKKAICTPKLRRLVYCCCYMQLHVVSRKQKECPSQSINLTLTLMRCKQTLYINSAQLKSKEKETQENPSKTKYQSFSFFSFFLLSRFHGNFGLNQLVSMRHLLFLSMT